MNRRGFLHQLGFTCFGALFIGACGSKHSDTAATTPATTPTTCDTGATVAYTNPGHTHSNIDFTALEIDTAAAGDYTLLGTGHTHTFSLTDADFTTLKSGTTVSKTDNEGHGHIVDIACATA